MIMEHDNFLNVSLFLMLRPHVKIKNKFYFFPSSIYILYLINPEGKINRLDYSKNAYITHNYRMAHSGK